MTMRHDFPEIIDLLCSLASEPPGGEVWSRSSKLKDYAERAAQLLADIPDLGDPNKQYANRLLQEQGWISEPVIGTGAVLVLLAKAYREGRGA